MRSMPDKGKRMYCFEVTCGKTGVPFEMCSDDQRSKHEWMLAIKKVLIRGIERKREREREREERERGREDEE